MLMDNDHTFSRKSRPDACIVSRGEAWKSYRTLALEATRVCSNMLATSGFYLMHYNICLANCTMMLFNCASTFGREPRRTNAPFDFLQPSNSYTGGCMNALHQYDERLTHLTKNALDDIVMPIRINAILAYGVIR